MPKKGADERTRPVTEQILVEAARIYDARLDEETESKDLKSYAAFLSKEDAFTKHLPQDLLDRARNMRPPRDRITCLLIGNHSAGKSSFTNWYVGEKIQNESVAIETAGITIVRRGKGRVSWKGPQTINAFPYLEKLGAMDGVTDFLCTEFSTSTEKNFPLVEFIDTPGLTDGTLKYPFDVDEVICELAEHATMIMVFLDPIGKALVSRCMNVVERLAIEHSAKMSYYLTKFDTAGDEVDRTNVVSQIVQELQGRVRATHALKLHTMFLPERASEETRKMLPNKIGDLCLNISKEIDSRVQDVLDGLSKDCNCLSKIVDEKVARNKKCVTHNTFSSVWKAAIGLLALVMAFVGIYWTMVNHAELDPLEICDHAVGKVVTRTLPDGSQIQEIKDSSANANVYCFALRAGGGIPCGVGLLMGIVWLMYLWVTKTKRTEQLSTEEMKKLKEIQVDINTNVIKKHKLLKKRLTEDALDDQLS